MRVAPRRLDGWEPRVVSVPEYDGDRIVRTVEYREPEWDDEQRELMIAYKRFLDDLGPHGHLRSESMSADADPNNYDSPLRFVADDPVIDWAEKTRLDRIDQWRQEAGDKANMNGLVFRVRKLGG